MHAGSAQIGKGRGAAARSGAAAPSKAQQADSEDTVTISALETGEDTETDDESAPPDRCMLGLSLDIPNKQRYSRGEFAHIRNACQYLLLFVAAGCLGGFAMCGSV